MLELSARNADTAVGDADRKTLFIDRRHFDGNAGSRRRIFDGIVDEVRYSHAQLVVVAENKWTRIVVETFRILDRTSAELSLNCLQAFLYNCAEIDYRMVDSAAALPSSPGLKHLFDGAQQPVRIHHHNGVELLPV